MYACPRPVVESSSGREDTDMSTCPRHPFPFETIVHRVRIRSGPQGGPRPAWETDPGPRRVGPDGFSGIPGGVRGGRAPSARRPSPGSDHTRRGLRSGPRRGPDPSRSARPAWHQPLRGCVKRGRATDVASDRSTSIFPSPFRSCSAPLGTPNASDRSRRPNPNITLLRRPKVAVKCCGPRRAAGGGSPLRRRWAGPDGGRAADRRPAGSGGRRASGILAGVAASPADSAAASAGLKTPVREQ